MRLTSISAIGMVFFAFWLAPSLAMATPHQAGTTITATRTTPVVGPAIGTPATDGRLFGHLPYGEASAGDMVTVAPGFGLGAPCQMQRDAAAALTQLIEIANATPRVSNQLRGVSCYRTIAHQRAVFCRAGTSDNPCPNPQLRAQSVGPPGFSEHATGYAIDFGVRPSPGCPDVDACIANTPAGQWLLVHAPDFGFELSFPAGNAQNVTWEPWHWRWVGTSMRAPGAVRARQIFARARNQFPGKPAIDSPRALIQAKHATPTPVALPYPVFWPGLYY